MLLASASEQVLLNKVKQHPDVNWLWQLVGE